MSQKAKKTNKVPYGAAVTLLALSLLLAGGDPVRAAEPAAAIAPVAAPAVPAPATAPANIPAVAAPIAASQAALPAVEGTYDVSGVQAVDKSTYNGIATVSKKDETYKVVYQDDEEKLVGVGMVTGGVFGVAFTSEGKPCLLLLQPDGANGWKGYYSEVGENFLNAEQWKRR